MMEKTSTKEEERTVGDSSVASFIVVWVVLRGPLISVSHMSSCQTIVVLTMSGTCVLDSLYHGGGPLETTGPPNHLVFSFCLVSFPLGITIRFLFFGRLGGFSLCRHIGPPIYDIHSQGSRQAIATGTSEYTRCCFSSLDYSLLACPGID